MVNSKIKQLLTNSEGIFISLSKKENTEEIIEEINKLRLGSNLLYSKVDVEFDIDIEYFISKISKILNEHLIDGLIDGYIPIGETFKLLLWFGKFDLIPKKLLIKEELIDLLNNISVIGINDIKILKTFKEVLEITLDKNRAQKKQIQIFNMLYDVTIKLDMMNNTTEIESLLEDSEEIEYKRLASDETKTTSKIITLSKQIKDKEEREKFLQIAINNLVNGYVEENISELVENLTKKYNLKIFKDLDYTNPSNKELDILFSTIGMARDVTEIGKAISKIYFKEISEKNFKGFIETIYFHYSSTLLDYIKDEHTVFIEKLAEYLLNDKNKKLLSKSQREYHRDNISILKDLTKKSEYLKEVTVNILKEKLKKAKKIKDIFDLNSRLLGIDKENKDEITEITYSKIIILNDNIIFDNLLEIDDINQKSKGKIEEYKQEIFRRMLEYIISNNLKITNKIRKYLKKNINSSNMTEKEKYEAKIQINNLDNKKFKDSWKNREKINIFSNKDRFDELFNSGKKITDEDIINELKRREEDDFYMNFNVNEIKEILKRASDKEKIKKQLKSSTFACFDIITDFNDIKDLEILLKKVDEDTYKWLIDKFKYRPKIDTKVFEEYKRNNLLIENEKINEIFQNQLIKDLKYKTMQHIIQNGEVTQEKHHYNHNTFNDVKKFAEKYNLDINKISGIKYRENSVKLEGVAISMNDDAEELPTAIKEEILKLGFDEWIKEGFIDILPIILNEKELEIEVVNKFKELKNKGISEVKKFLNINHKTSDGVKKISGILFKKINMKEWENILIELKLDWSDFEKIFRAINKEKEKNNLNVLSEIENREIEFNQLVQTLLRTKKEIEEREKGDNKFGYSYSRDLGRYEIVDYVKNLLETYQNLNIELPDYITNEKVPKEIKEVLEEKIINYKIVLSEEKHKKMKNDLLVSFLKELKNFNNEDPNHIKSLIKNLYKSEYFSAKEIIEIVEKPGVLNDEIKERLLAINTWREIFIKFDLKDDDFMSINELNNKKSKILHLKTEGLSINTSLNNEVLINDINEFMKNKAGVTSYDHKDYTNNPYQINENSTPLSLKVLRSSEIHATYNNNTQCKSVLSIAKTNLGETSDLKNINRINKAIQDYLMLKPTEVKEKKYKLITNITFVNDDRSKTDLEDYRVFLQMLLKIVKKEKEEGVDKIILLSSELIPDDINIFLKEMDIKLLFNKKEQKVIYEREEGDTKKRLDAKSKLYEMNPDNSNQQVILNLPVNSLIERLEVDIETLLEYERNNPTEEEDFQLKNIENVCSRRSGFSYKFEYLNNNKIKKEYYLEKMELKIIEIFKSDKSTYEDYFFIYTELFADRTNSDFFKPSKKTKEIILKKVKYLLEKNSSLSLETKKDKMILAIFLKTFNIEDYINLKLTIKDINEMGLNVNVKIDDKEFQKKIFEHYCDKEYIEIFKMIIKSTDTTISGVFKEQLKSILQKAFNKDEINKEIKEIFNSENEKAKATFLNLFNKTERAYYSDKLNQYYDVSELEISNETLKNIITFIVSRKEEYGHSFLIKFIEKLEMNEEEKRQNIEEPAKDSGVEPKEYKKQDYTSTLIELNNKYYDEGNYDEQTEIFKAVEVLINSVGVDMSEIKLFNRQVNELMRNNGVDIYHFYEKSDSNDEENNKITLSNEYIRESFIDFINFDFYNKISFISFIEKDEETMKLFEDAVTPDLLLKYGEKNKLEIKELNEEIKELIKRKKEISELQKNRKNTKSKKRQEEIDKELESINEEEVNEKIKEIDKKFRRVWKSWYKDININLSIFNTAIYSSLMKVENILDDESGFKLPSKITMEDFNKDLFNQLKALKELPSKEWSFEQFMNVINHNPEPMFVFSIMQGVDIDNKFLIDSFNINETMSKEDFERLKNFDIKKYLKIKSKVLSQLNITFSDLSEVEKEVLEKILNICNYDLNQIKVFIEFIKEFETEFTLDDFHYLNLDLVNKIGGVREYFKYAKKIIPYIQNDYEVTPEEQTHLNTDVLRYGLNNIDYVFKELDGLSYNGSVLYNTLKVKKLNMKLDNPRMLKDLSHAISSAATNDMELSISNTSERALNKINENLKRFNLNYNDGELKKEQDEEQIEFKFDNFLYFKRLYQTKTGAWAMQEDISPFDTRTYSQGYATQSCLTPDGLAKKILKDMSENPSNWATLLISIEKRKISSDNIKLLSDLIDKFNEGLLNGVYKKELDFEIINLNQKLFYTTGASASWKKSMQRTYDNMETYNKTFVIDKDGNKVRINTSDDYIIDAIKESAKNDSLYSEMKVLSEMSEHYKLKGNFRDFSFGKHQFYHTIGSGYSDISLSTFNKHIPNRQDLQEQTHVYTDASRNQQYLVDTHSKLKLNNQTSLIEYFQTFQQGNEIISKIEKRIEQIKKEIKANISKKQSKDRVKEIKR